MHQLFENNAVNLLWHPTFSGSTEANFASMIGAITNGRTQLDILCVEGFILNGEDGGWLDTVLDRPKRELILDLAQKAAYVVAIGTCAAFGGVGADAGVGACGLQFTRDNPGGLLDPAFRSGKGLPVINIPGCPIHGAIIYDVLSVLLNDGDIQLTDLNEPEDWYGLYVHQGCIRNEYHEYRVEEREFGDRGCLFFHMGCRGPLTKGPCNKVHWNRRSSKTNVGVPCVGCTDANFPPKGEFFKTRQVDGEPAELPEGVDRERYIRLKNVAYEAAPDRLKKRETPL